MKFLIVVSIVFTLTGCGYQDSLSRAKQDYTCRDDGGVYKYYDISRLNGLVCKNGKRVIIDLWKDVILPPDYYPKKINSIGWS